MAGFMEAQLAIYAAADETWQRNERTGTADVGDQYTHFYGYELPYGIYLGGKRTIMCRDQGSHSGDPRFVHFDIVCAFS